MKKFTIEMENGGKMIGELYPEIVSQPWERASEVFVEFRKWNGNVPGCVFDAAHGHTLDYSAHNRDDESYYHKEQDQHYAEGERSQNPVRSLLALDSDLLEKTHYRL